MPTFTTGGYYACIYFHDMHCCTDCIISDEQLRGFIEDQSMKMNKQTMVPSE